MSVGTIRRLVAATVVLLPLVASSPSWAQTATYAQPFIFSESGRFDGWFDPDGDPDYPTSTPTCTKKSSVRGGVAEPVKSESTYERSWRTWASWLAGLLRQIGRP